MKTAVILESLPFDEAIKFFRGKVNIPTERWNDLWKDMHARGFMVAGAMKTGLLTDFRGAIDKAISEGTTLQEFRKDFDRTVKTHGWSYKGERGWRTGVIYNTNVRTAYSAGRYKQMTDPDVMQARPYWQYRHGDSINPRPEHLSWNGLVLAADDPWWRVHYPPNGWGCKCMVTTLSERELAKKGKSGPDAAPNNGTYEWTDKRTGEVHRVPNGIDPGWDYNVGTAAWGEREQLRLMEDTGPWTDLSPLGHGKYGRPDKISVDAPRAELGNPVKKGDAPALREALTKALGSEASNIIDPLGEPVRVTQAIVGHILEKPETRWDGRDAYFPFIRELIEDPFEIWMSFAKSAVSGRVGIRRKYVKAVKLSGNKALGLYAESMDGYWVSGDLFRGNITGAKNIRKGRMIYGR